MGALQQRAYSLDDYFAVEAASPTRHEFLDGAILAMARGSVRHNRICARLLVLLGSALDDETCSAFGSDLRVATSTGLYTYADLTIVCGPIELVPDRPDTVLNPSALVEVLSPSTRDYDCGEKLSGYLLIPSLREILLVEQDRPAVRRLMREGSGWRDERFDDLDATVMFAGVTLPLREVYRRAFD